MGTVSQSCQARLFDVLFLASPYVCSFIQFLRGKQPKREMR